MDNKKKSKRLIAKELKKCLLLLLSCLILGMITWSVYAIANRPPYITDEQFIKYEKAKQIREEKLNEAAKESEKTGDPVPYNIYVDALDTSIISLREYYQIASSLTSGSTKYDKNHEMLSPLNNPSYKTLNIYRKEGYREDLKDKLVHCLVYLPLVVLFFRWLFLAIVALFKFIKKYGN